MFLSDFSIRRPVVTLALIMVLMGCGLLALSKLRVNQNPDVLYPTLYIQVVYPGASPDSVEREVVNRLEKPLQSIPGLNDLKVTASEGSATFLLSFEFKKSLIEATDEVRNAIASVRYKLPSEMREPSIQRAGIDNQSLMSLGLSSKTLSHAEISHLAEDSLAERLRAVDGVATVKVVGALQRELSVLLRSEKMRAFNVSVQEVVQALRNQNTTAPVGKVRNALEQQSIRMVGRIESPAEFEQVVVKQRGNDVVRLGQVASIADGFAELESYSAHNGYANINLEIVRSRDASEVAVAARLRAVVAEFSKTLPKGTELDIAIDGGKNAQSQLGNVIESLWVGAILTILVVFTFLNSWRSTLITALSLPTSAIAAFIAIWLAGFTLNFMTLLGLSLAIGVLIDDAIVVRENIVRQMERGLDRRTAARVGTAEIGLAVAATTFSIIAVFVPVAFIPGITGEWFRPFATTVASSVLVSLLISFTLDPMLSAYWGDPVGQHLQPRRGLGKLLARFNVWFDHQSDRYSRVIGWALKYRWSMVSIALLSLVGAIWLQGQYGGTEFFPRSDGGTLLVTIRAPSSSSLEYSRLKVEKVAEIARQLPEAKATNSSSTAGDGRVYVDIGKRDTRSRSAGQIAVDLRRKLSRLVGAEYTVFDDLNGGGKPVQLQFFGQDSRRLLALTSAFMDELRKVPGAVDVGLSEQAPQNELRIELQRGLANNLGISANDAAQALRVAFAGIEIGDWIDPNGETRDVAVRLHPDDRVNLESIARLPIAVAGTDRLVPLDQIATIVMGKAPAQIQHLGGKRVMTVAANTEGRSSGEVTANARALAKKLDFPPGYGYSLGGTSKDQEEVFGAMLTAVLAGVGLMYLVLVMQFGSFTAPLAVIVSLPLSLIGVVLALLATHSTINLMSLIGVVMLMGLVAKNAILLLDCARSYEAEGHGREEALMYAGRKRLRPILMTTFALIAGMLPVAIGRGDGGEFYQPMAIAIIGGMITSTLLTLLVVPTVYDLIEIGSDKLFRRKSRAGSPGHAPVAVAG
jgi:hydrophobe/amphiphile efflux-1 (HAE1) family protein